MTRWICLGVLGALIGCQDKAGDGTDTGPSGVDTVTDSDNDGYDAAEDCDDNNALVNPGAAEVCDGLDNNCDGAVDEDVTTTFYADADADGFGDDGAPIEACELPDGYVSVGNDCDDADSSAYPGAAEVCDGLDNNCDGNVDEDVTTEFYADLDGDGYGDPGNPAGACEVPSGYVTDDSDCDDSRTDVNPDAAEVCDEADNNCDGAVDEDVTTTFYVDTDGDGYGVSDKTTEACVLPGGYADTPGDCDDADVSISPDAAEVCDDIDNDCDTLIDDDDDSVDTSTGDTFYADGDGDTYGDPDDTTWACAQPAGYVSDSADCDDSNATINPAAAEVCDDIDNDCDGDTDDDDSGVDTSTGDTFYADDDGDGFGDPDDTTMSCEMPSGHLSDSTDCDDSNSTINPDASEVCDDIDNDCDGDIDDDDSSVDTATGDTFYEDDDGDGYGDADDDVMSCEQPSGYVSDDTDCDDADAAINPAAAEVCDDTDNDCDGDTDDDDSDVDTATGDTFYEDDDGDGYGDELDPLDACELPSGYADNSDDCDDTDSAISPAAAEVCDDEDNDCDGDIDDADSDVDTSGGELFYDDDDGDGYGDPDSSTRSCAEPSGAVEDNTDCDDTDSDTYPSAAELCDGDDNDCDGDTDEGVIGQSTSCPAESCAEIVDLGADSGDGDYYLDPDGSGGALYACDMSTDGGGWTEVAYWNRIDDGDSQSDFESLMTENYNNMGNFSTGSSALQWNDGGSNAKAMDYEHEVEVPNDGEVMFSLYYYGYSMEDSSVFFYMTTDAGDEEDLYCLGLRSGAASAYSSTEYSYHPDYTCSTTAESGVNHTESQDKETYSFSDPVTSFHITSLHYDNGTGDYSYLYNFAVWVR